MKRICLFGTIGILLVVLVMPVLANNDIEISGVLSSRFDLEFSSTSINQFIDGALKLSITDEIESDRFVKLEAEFSNQKEQLIRLKEAFMDIYFESTDLRIGQQRIAWGKADGINPTDNFNPVNYTRPFAEDNRIEIPALRLKHYYEDWIFDVVWVPFFIPAKLPESGSRWSSDNGQIPSLPFGYELNSIEVKPIMEPISI